MSEHHHGAEPKAGTTPDGGTFTSQINQSDPADASAVRDAHQTLQIQSLNRKVIYALIGAVAGPLIAVTGLLFSALQWVAMRDQIDDTRNSTKLEYRAWVFVTKAEVSSTGVRIEARNMGRTPALDVLMIGSTHRDRPPLLDFFTGAIPPGEVQQFEIPPRDDWADGGIIDGDISYRDVFGEQHRTRFCFGVSVEDRRPSLTRCSAHNTDDDYGQGFRVVVP